MSTEVNVTKVFTNEFNMRAQNRNKKVTLLLESSMSSKLLVISCVFKKSILKFPLRMDFI